MIVWDTETTGLMKPEVADLEAQPRIIEIGMARIDESTHKVMETFHALVNPTVPIDEEVHKRITGLTNAALADAPTFLEVVDEIADFLLGEYKWVAHNLAFDRGVLVCDLKRIGREFSFPYPPQQVCTVEHTQHLKGRRLKLTELYKLKLKKDLAQTHRALDDVHALCEIVEVMKL